MTNRDAVNNWEKIPARGATCRICRGSIFKADRYEVVKRGKFATFYHTSCMEKEAQNNG